MREKQRTSAREKEGRKTAEGVALQAAAQLPPFLLSSLFCPFFFFFLSSSFTCVSTDVHEDELSSLHNPLALLCRLQDARLDDHLIIGRLHNLVIVKRLRRLAEWRADVYRVKRTLQKPGERLAHIAIAATFRAGDKDDGCAAFTPHGAGKVME